MGGRGSAHPRQACLGGDAPVHHPGAIGFAVERLDLLQEVLQGGGVGGIAGQDLIGQRKALGGDDQGDHHLHAVRPLVAAVAEFALALLAPRLSPGGRRRALEIGAGQVVEQNLEADREEALPTRLQGDEEIRLVSQQLIQAAVQLVDLDQAQVLAQEITDGALLVPLAMQAPLAAGIEQPVEHQRLQHVQPARPLAAGRQLRRPEGVQAQLIPQPSRQPTAAPLPRTPELQVSQAHLHHFVIRQRRRPTLGKQGHLPRHALALGKHFNGPPPGGLLAVVDLAEIKHLALNHAATTNPTALHKTPGAVHLAVLAPGLAAKKHAPESAEPPPSRSTG